MGNVNVHSEFDVAVVLVFRENFCWRIATSTLAVKDRKIFSDGFVFKHAASLAVRVL
jgi:hypothetical protein